MTKIYPDDLSDDEWAIVEPLLKTKHWNREPKPIYSKKSMLNAIFYVCRTGCGWRHLPKDYPPWPICLQSVQKVEGVWRLPEGVGSTKTAGTKKVWQERRANRKGGFKGYDGGKKIKGRKRYIKVDTQGTLIAGAVTAANLNDQQGLYLLLDTFRFSGMKKIWADMGFKGKKQKHMHLTMDAIWEL